MDIKLKLLAAARLLKCEPDDFLAHGERANGDLVVINARGQKFVYSVAELARVGCNEASGTPPSPSRTRSPSPDRKGGQKPPDGEKQPEHDDRKEHDSRGGSKTSKGSKKQ